MKLKLSQILNSKESILRIIKVELPIRVSYSLSKIFKKLSSELELIEEQRISLVKKYGEEKDGTISVPENMMSTYIQEFLTFLNTEEVDLPIDDILIDMNSIPEDTPITTEDISAIDFIFKIDEENSEKKSGRKKKFAE